jgi:hypothetical protein
MPLKLNVGLSKKVGLPDYGSLGASCHVEVELDGTLIQQDLDGFHRHVRNAYVACAQAVNDELARHNGRGAGSQAGNGAQGIPAGNGNGHAEGRRRSGARKATASQVRAINAIADRQGLDLTQLLRNQFNVDDPRELSITEASGLIDGLKATTNGAGGGR